MEQIAWFCGDIFCYLQKKCKKITTAFIDSNEYTILYFQNNKYPYEDMYLIYIHIKDRKKESKSQNILIKKSKVVKRTNS